jgi:hypothetical protein
MAFTASYLPYSRGRYFYYYAATAGAANESLDECLNLSQAFEICDVRLHLSAVHQSTESFVVTMNAGIGTKEYDTVIIDWSAENLQDYVWRPSTTPMIFARGDMLSFLLVKSHVDNGTAGLIVTGWEIARL